MSKINLPHHEFTREFLEDKYGSFRISYIDENHSKDWLESLNNSNKKIYTQNFEKIPMGLNKKVSLYFFQHFFNWDKTGFQVDNFHGNWLDVPFPNVTHMKYCLGTIILPDLSYNWYELFIVMDDIMWDTGRVLDVGITSLKPSKDNDKVLEVDWSSQSVKETYPYSHSQW